MPRPQHMCGSRTGRPPCLPVTGSSFSRQEEPVENLAGALASGSGISMACVTPCCRGTPVQSSGSQVAGAGSFLPTRAAPQIKAVHAPGSTQPSCIHGPFSQRCPEAQGSVSCWSPAHVTPLLQPCLSHALPAPPAAKGPAHPNHPPPNPDSREKWSLFVFSWLLNVSHLY